MHKRTCLFIVLVGLLALLLSGCFSQRYEVRHNPDGSGRFSLETIFTQEYLVTLDEGLTMEEARPQILSESVLNKDEIPLDNPNILDATERDFIDPATGSLHHIIELEIQNLLEPIQFDPLDDYSEPFRIQDYGDGTYLFSAVIESLSEFIGDEMEDDQFDREEARLMMEGSSVSWLIHVVQFIEGDERAVFDPGSGTVSWEIPMFDAMLGEEPVQIFAIYRLDSEPIPDQADPGLPPEEIGQPTAGITDGLPAWLPLSLAALLCLGLGFALLVVVVLIVLLRRR